MASDNFDGEKTTVGAVMASPFFILGFRHGFHDRIWPRSYERWPRDGQLNYERGRQFAQYCLRVAWFEPIKIAGAVREAACQVLGIARRDGDIL